MPTEYFNPVPGPSDDHEGTYAPVKVGYIRKWGENGPKDYRMTGEGLSTYESEGITPEKLTLDEIAALDMPSSSHTYAPESITRRALVIYGFMAVALGGAAVGVRKAAKEVNEYFEGEPPCRRVVKDGDTLTAITEELYPLKTNDREWISHFVTHNISNTTEDGRPRDENTIYPGDILEITLDPNEDATLGSCELAE